MVPFRSHEGLATEPTILDRHFGREHLDPSDQPLDGSCLGSERADQDLARRLQDGHIQGFQSRPQTLLKSPPGPIPIHQELHWAWCESLESRPFLSDRGEHALDRPATVENDDPIDDSQGCQCAAVSSALHQHGNGVGSLAMTEIAERPRREVEALLLPSTHGDATPYDEKNQRFISETSLCSTFSIPSQQSLKATLSGVRDGAQMTTEYGGPAEDTIFAVLYDKFVFWSIIVGVIVFAWLIWTILRYRDGVEPNVNPDRIEVGVFPVNRHNARAEFAWFAVPTLLVVWLTVLATMSIQAVWTPQETSPYNGYCTWMDGYAEASAESRAGANQFCDYDPAVDDGVAEGIADGRMGDGAFEIAVEGYQWAWRFTYLEALTYQSVTSEAYEHDDVFVSWNSGDRIDVTDRTGIGAAVNVRLFVDGQTTPFHTETVNLTSSADGNSSSVSALLGADLANISGANDLHRTLEVVDVDGTSVYEWGFIPAGHEIDTQYVDELLVPCDVGVRFYISGQDVQHSFFLPEWGIKEDIVPSNPNGSFAYESQMAIVPDRVGEYPIVCAEYCGLHHAKMKAKIVVTQYIATDSRVVDCMVDTGLEDNDPATEWDGDY